MSAFRRPAFLRKLLHRNTFDRFTAPRRPRHPMLRVAAGLIGVGLLLALLFVSVFVGIAMLAGGMLLRSWTQRGKPITREASGKPIDAHVIDGRFRVVGKPQLPLAR